MKIYETSSRHFILNANIFLTILVVFVIFFIPFFPRAWHTAMVSTFFSFIFLAGIFALESWRQRMIIIVVMAIVTEWISTLFKMSLLNYLSLLANVLFFQIIVIRFIVQIARSKQADALMILESINGYLMMGLMFSTWVAMAMFHDPSSFRFTTNDPLFSDFTYYTFITMTTVGYGDITPNLPFARSISILISTSGQLYIAVIIAMLVGKYSSKAK